MEETGGFETISTGLVLEHGRRPGEWSRLELV